VLPPVAPLELGGTDTDPVCIGGGQPLALIAGPCVIESESSAMRICAALRAVTSSLGVPFVFKASFDKANRTSLQSFRGPGLAEGLGVLAAVRERFGVPVTTDVHLPQQAASVAAVADLLQVPAFLCRQTDLLLSCAATGRPVNVKKGQFMAPDQMGPVVAKLVSSGANGVMVTERGTSFGHHDLVVDLRGLPRIRHMGVPVCFDATHAVQRPGAAGDRSGGDREYVPALARGAVAVGVDALFLEVHDDPDQALSDSATMLPLGELPALLERVLALDAVIRGRPQGGDQALA